MSPSDTQKLQDFLGQLVQARGIQKDPEADALIQRAVTQQPDAAYLLVQRALLMEQALDAAKSRIAMLESQLDSQQGNSSGGGFLDPNNWGNRHRSQSQSQHHQSQHMSQQHAAPASMSRNGSGGLLGSIAATAAGVAAGSFLFHGLDNLFHDHDSGGNPSHLLSDNDQSANSLAAQADINDIDQADSLTGDTGDTGGLDGPGGFFDGDGSDEGLFS